MMVPIFDFSFRELRGQGQGHIQVHMLPKIPLITQGWLWACKILNFKKFCMFCFTDDYDDIWPVEEQPVTFLERMKKWRPSCLFPPSSDVDDDILDRPEDIPVIGTSCMFIVQF